MIIHTNQDNFEKVKNSSKLFLLDIFATWCAPCQMLGEEFEKLAKTNNSFDIVKIDADENNALAASLGVRVLPTMFVFKDGKQIDRVEGFMTANQLEKFMQKYQ